MKVRFLYFIKIESKSRRKRMLKVRLMGTKNDIKWFKKILEREKKLNILQCSEPYSLKGTDRFYRVYVEVEKNRK